MSASNQEYVLEASIVVRAPADLLWKEVTEVDIASFRHPLYLRALGVPKPLNATVVASGVGGARIAHFSNGRSFSQAITEWEPNVYFGFTFHADPGFRVGWLLDLGSGPFCMRSGAYRFRPADSGIELTLVTRYSLRGVAGACLKLPVGLILRIFQRYFLAGIRRNAERGANDGESVSHA
jgi:hypothetical protein